MQRVIEQKMIDAIQQVNNMKSNNTHVIVSDSQCFSDIKFLTVKLFGNIIACCHYDNGKPVLLRIFDCYRSVTTKRRLNAVLTAYGIDAIIYQHKWNWYIATYQGEYAQPFAYIEFNLP